MRYFILFCQYYIYTLQALKVYRILGYLTILQTAFSILLFIVATLKEEQKRAKNLVNIAKGQTTETKQVSFSVF